MIVDRQLPILIADRNQSAVFVIRRQLAALGLMYADETTDGPDALLKLRAQTYGLIIADATLRNTNISGLWHAAQTSAWQSAPSFIVTRPGAINPEVIGLPRQASVVHLIKPFSTTDLRNAIDALCTTRLMAA